MDSLRSRMRLFIDVAITYTNILPTYRTMQITLDEIYFCLQ